MKNRIHIRITAFLAALCLLAVPCAAADYGATLGTDELEDAVPEAAEQALGTLQVENAELDSGLARIFDFLREQFRGVLSEVLRPLIAASECAGGV